MFYVYRIIGEMGETLYIGKGTGRRLEQQKKRFRSEGEVLQTFSTEEAAYRREKRLIDIHQPPLNQCSGGAGGKFGRTMGESEGAIFVSIARIIRKLSKFGSFTLLGVEIKREELEQMLSKIIQKYDPAYLATKLAPYNVAIEFVDNSPLRTGE